MNSIISPLTGEKNVTFLYTIDAEKLAVDYTKNFNINIRKYLRGNKIISVYKCDRTGYRFYYPLDIIGDGDFYTQLEKYDWYYLDTKWEHDEALKMIKVGDHILEIGAAKGSFLERAMELEKVSCVGLDLNSSAVSRARAKGYNVFNETAEDHAKNHIDEYDVVCLFQVLEHVSNPASLLESAIRMLKRGGRLIIGVPDNSIRSRSSIFVTTENILNMPPHHMGLWDVVSLSSLDKIFPLRLKYMVVEPAEATNWKNAYRGLIKENLKNKYGFLGIGYYLTIRPAVKYVLNYLAPYLPAHTILAGYIKI